MADSLVILIQSDDIFASTLLCLAVDRFGTDLFLEEGGTWTPETFRMEFRAVFGCDISDDNLGKLMAGLSVLTSDALYRNLSSFLFTVHGLLGDGTDWSYAEPIEAEDLAWTVMESLLISPPEEGELFDPQIVAYCRTILKAEGLMSPPAVLAFAREEAVYGDIGQFGDDILTEQASRTQEVNESIESRQLALYEQLASIEPFGCSADSLAVAVRLELEELAGQGKWL
jgi:hypothetical protein